MITAPTNWNTLYSDANALLELRFTVGTDIYYNESIEGDSCRLTHQLYQSYGIGNACAARLDITLWDVGSIAEGMLECSLDCRMASADGQTVTQWVSQGKYYLDTVDFDAESDTAKLTCYDGMALTDIYLYEGGETPSTETWPKTAQQVVQIVCNRTGITFPSSTSGWGSLSCQKVDYITCREALQSIAACAGGNWTITKSGILKFMPLKGFSGTATAGSVSVETLDQTSKTRNVGGLILKNGGNTYTRGSGVLVIQAESMYATESIATNVYNQILNLQYAGFSAHGCYVTPLVELGDLMTVDNTSSKMFIDSVSLKYNGGLWGDIESPLTDGIEQRIKRQGQYERAIDRLISQSSLMQSEIDEMSTAQYVTDLLARINEQANITGGYTYITEGGGIVTYDQPVTDPLVGAEALKMTAVKGGLIYIANRSSTQEAWTLQSMIQDGHIAAQLVTVANLVAGFIGSISGNYWNLDTGLIHTQAGEIGGFNITVSSLYNGLETVDGTTTGVYVGTNGISVGGRTGSAITGIKRTRITFDNGSIKGYQNEVEACMISPTATIRVQENGATTDVRGTIIKADVLILDAKHLGVATRGSTPSTSYYDTTAESALSMTENVFDLDTISSRLNNDGNLELDKTKTALKYVNGMLVGKTTSTTSGPPSVVLVNKPYLDSRLSDVSNSIPTFTLSGGNLYIRTT